MEEQLTPSPALLPQKPNYWIWIGVCVLMLALGIGIGLFLSRDLYPPLQILPAPTPSPIAVVDPTANWKTYTNAKFGYQLKYPDNWLLTEPCEKNCPGPISTSVRSPSSVNPDGQLVVEIQNPTCQGLANQSWSKPVNKTNTMIGGQTGLLITGKLDLNDNQLHDVKNICIPFDGQGYHFSMWSLNNPEDVTIFDQILSTFKFPYSVAMDNANFNGWATYNDRYLSFKYPEQWVLSGYGITSTLPKIRLIVVPGDSTLMNECMQEISTETKNGLTIKKFARVTTGEMCRTSDSTPREIWIMPSATKYAPGLIFKYSSTDTTQAESIFNLILSSFSFVQ